MSNNPYWLESVWDSTLPKDQVFYAEPTVDALGNKTYTSVGGAVGATGGNAGVLVNSPVNTVAQGSLMIINASTVDATGGTTVFTKGLTNNSQVYLVNATDDMTVKLTGVANPTLGAIAWNGDRILLGTLTSDVNGGTVAIALEEYELVKYDLVAENAVKSLYENKDNNGTSKSARFNDWLKTEDNGLDGYDAVSEVADDVAAIADTAGMVNVTMDGLS